MTFKLNNIALASLAGMLMSGSALAGDFAATIGMEQQQLAATDDVTVNLTITNTNKKPARILKWYTAEDGMKEALFAVSRDGKPLHYLGAHFKRPAPTAADYITLKAGESVNWQVDLSAFYDMTKSGNYNITFDVESLNLFDDLSNGSKNRLVGHDVVDANDVAHLESNTVSVWIEGRESGNKIAKPPVDFIQMAGGVSYTGNCSNSEINQIDSGLAAASTMADDSVDYLVTYPSGSRSNSERYSTWFGSYSSSNWNTITDNFTAIKDAIDNKPLTFDCSCNDNYYAYVYPTQPYVVYLCNAYWAAPTSGTDSKGGTIVHELSHFNVVAGTDDLAYGQTNAKKLARKAKRAIRNADSHEYFAENTPKLD